MASKIYYAYNHKDKKQYRVNIIGKCIGNAINLKNIYERLSQ